MKRLVLLALVSLFVTVGFAQQKQITIRGIVLDKKAQPLSGVSVLTVNQSVSTLTDVNGVFSLTVAPQGNTVTLKFRTPKGMYYVVPGVKANDVVVVILDKNIKKCRWYKL